MEGSIQAAQVVTYTLGAGQFQPLTLIVGSPNKDVTLGVSEANGNVLLDPALKRTAWQTVLPSTELYTIQVIGGATTEQYSLTVKIPQVVNFASGTSSITLNGTTVNGYLYSYSFTCSAGQTMTASLATSSNNAYIDIYGLSSGTLLSSSAAANDLDGIPAANAGLCDRGCSSQWPGGGLFPDGFRHRRGGEHFLHRREPCHRTRDDRGGRTRHDPTWTDP